MYIFKGGSDLNATLGKKQDTSFYVPYSSRVGLYQMRHQTNLEAFRIKESILCCFSWIMYRVPEERNRKVIYILASHKGVSILLATLQF